MKLIRRVQAYQATRSRLLPSGAILWFGTRIALRNTDPTEYMVVFQKRDGDLGGWTVIPEASD